MEDTRTDFKDKSGRTIFIGDIVQHRLGKFGLSGGAKNYRVIKFGKKYHLVNESQIDTKYGGILLTEKLCDHLVVFKSSHIPQ